MVKLEQRKNFVTDRSPVDNIAYYLTQCSHNATQIQTNAHIVKAMIFAQKLTHLINIRVVNEEDIENNKEGSLNIEQAVKNINKPLLIVQGKNDLAVPVNEGGKLYDWSNKELTELLIIPAAGHTFDVKHPFDGSNNKFDTVLDNTNKFFETNLN
ncbi:MAG: hypothetical protein IIB08_02795 [Bacteroidetes bacterium]|nr:hypothetical protein [Bacteroidota bacterium]